MGATFDDKGAALLEQIRADQAAIEKLGAAINKAKQAASSARAAARDAKRAYIRLRTKQVTLTHAIRRKRERLHMRRRAWKLSIEDAERLVAMRDPGGVASKDRDFLRELGLALQYDYAIGGYTILEDHESKALFSALADRLRVAKPKKKGGKS